MPLTAVIFFSVQLAVCLWSKDRKSWLLFTPFVLHPIFVSSMLGLAVMYQLVAVIFYFFVQHRPFPALFFTLCSLTILLLNVSYTSLTIVTIFGYAAMLSFLIHVEHTDNVELASDCGLGYNNSIVASIKNVLAWLQTSTSAKNKKT